MDTKDVAAPQIPAGIKLMMKSFGMDPQAITETIGASVRAFTAKVDELQATQTRIEQKQDAIIDALKQALPDVVFHGTLGQITRINCANER